MDDLISRKAAIEIASGFCHPANIAKELAKLPSAQPEQREDTISRQAAIEITKTCDFIRDNNIEGGSELLFADDVRKCLEELPSAQPVAKDINVPVKDCISRQSAIDALDCINGVEEVLRSLPSAQPEPSQCWGCNCEKMERLEPCEDAVSRQDAIRIVDGIDTWQAGWRGDAIESMKALPSAQLEIVRCKECKHHDGIRCFRWNSTIITKFDDFCSNAERRTDDR